MFAYFTRVFGYTMVKSPWLILLLEPLHGVTYALSKTASVDFITTHTPKGYESTGQALITALRMGVGNLLGLYLGGIIAEGYGQVALYRYAGALVAVVFVLFLLVQIGKIKKMFGRKLEDDRLNGIELR